MSLNGNAAILKAIGLILAGAIAGLSGGAYSGNHAGATAVHRELAAHETQIKELNKDVTEIKGDVKEVQRDLGEFRQDVDSKRDSIKDLIRETSQ